ncbi:MAG TPA: sigma 54-interacting transcriptional regulator [Gammaproteobacteria bacterium]
MFIAVLLAALIICTSLFFFSQKRLYQETRQQSEEMVEAASLAFSQALAANDEVLLDALLHELQSRKHLHIEEAYILKPDGRVVAHSRVAEYGKTYPIPDLLTQPQPSQLYQSFSEDGQSFRVISLLQAKGKVAGALEVIFSTLHLSQKLLSQMYWIVGATVPILLLSGVGVMVYGRRMVARIKRLQSMTLAVGRGEWSEPVEMRGSDEISQLTAAFNQMLADLSALRAKDRESAGTIGSLNRDLHAQLKKVEELREQLAAENAVLRQQLQAQDVPGEIVGANGGLRAVMAQARQIAPLAINVLITGESGTGKELLATYLHEASPGVAGPLVKINCAALPVTLIESELFGHEKGAFTGAIAQKKGKFELAHGGTLFLDEVGELPLEAQAKLLRALQHGEITRVGADRPIVVEVRVIAATNRVLADEVARGKFREDLYYRLKVVELDCPPLRARLEDLPLLAQHFVEQYGLRLHKPVVGISPSAIQRLLAYRWPGNIRELEHMVARAVALATTQVLGADDFMLPAASLDVARSSNSAASPFDQLLAFAGLNPAALARNGLSCLLDACERICLEAVLKTTKNQKAAATTLGLNETRMHRLLRKHGLGRRNTETVETSENRVGE